MILMKAAVLCLHASTWNKWVSEVYIRNSLIY